MSNKIKSRKTNLTRIVHCWTEKKTRTTVNQIWNQQGNIYIGSLVILGKLEKGWPFCVVGLVGFAFEEVYHAEAVPGNKEKTY